MRVNAYCVEEDGSARYRVRWPAEAMANQGLDVEVCPIGVQTRDCEVVIFNRPVRQLQAQCVEELVKMGKRVVVDMDDWYDKIVNEHIAFGTDADEHIHRACKAASLVTVSTPALLEPYGYGHGVVVPNRVPEWMLKVESGWDHEKLWVMWAGSVAAHPTDLQSTNGQVAKAMQECQGQLAYIGPKTQGTFVKQFLKWKGDTFLSGWFDDQELLFQAVASADVGIVPLANNTFNTAKSWLKGLEFAACGVPFVASDTPDYRRLNKLGAGLLARHPRDWYFHARNLLKSKDMRDDLAGRGREVAASLTIEDHAPTLHAVWTQAEIADISSS